MDAGDGASFTGNRVDPVPVPGTSKSVHYRGARNLDATLDELFAHHGLKNATQVIVTGGSAGGLSTFLHLDHVAERVRVYAPLAKVVGKPVCGFFLDHGNDGFDKPNVTYPLRVRVSTRDILRYRYQMLLQIGTRLYFAHDTHTHDPQR